MTSIETNIAGQTRSKLAMGTRKINPSKVLNTVLADFITERNNKTAIANAVIDQKTGQMMEHRHLISHKNPKIKAIWNESDANELGRLF